MRLIFTFSIVFLASVHAISPIVGVGNAKAVPDSYIVVFKNDISIAAIKSHLRLTNEILGMTKKSDFDLGGFKGYHVQASKSVIERLAESDEIDYIEADFTISLPQTTHHKTSARTARNVQSSAPWGLARISHRQRGSTDYVFQPTTGTYVYVLDTGVKITHTQFQGLATFGFNAVAGSSNDDLNGHGTHIAGIASSQTYGVARFASIVSVKVLGDEGSSTVSAIITGINWSVQDIQTKARVGKATALLAVGGSFSAALNSAVAAASNAGLMFAVAAGNSNTNAGTTSPGSEPTACTVGGTTASDAVMSTSNYGPVVDIYAPGQLIPSVGIASNTAVVTFSGTSMAAAHIAGLGAYFLALEGPRSAAALCARLREVATPNVLTGIPAGTSNLLAYNLSGL